MTSAEPNDVMELVDTELERMLVAAVLADPSRLVSLRDFAVMDLCDYHAVAAFSAIRDVQERGQVPTAAAVRERLVEEMLFKEPGRKINEHPQLGDLVWFDKLVATPLPTPDPLVSSWAFRITDLAVRRLAALKAGDQVEADEADVDRDALADAEPAPAPGQALVAPRARWILPLESFLGDEEPDDDDSQDWVIRNIIPRGEAALIAGPPKCGKTWAMLLIGICVALGLPWLGTFDNTMGGPCRVLLLAFEDGQRRLRKRVWELCRAIGISPNHPTLRAHLSIGREPLSLPGDERAFAAELKAWKPTVVGIDNLTRVMAGDQNAIKDAKRFSDVWCKLGQDVGASVTFLHHTSKIGPIRPDQRNQGDPFELIRGSGDLVASARHLVLMRPLESPDDNKLADVRMRGNLDLAREDFVFSFARERMLDRWNARLAFRGDGETVRDELAEKRREKVAERKASRSGRGEDSANSVDERVYAKIVELVHAGSRNLCTLEQLKDSCGVQRAAVKPALERLVDQARRVRIETVRRFEGSGMRSRAIYVPVESGSA